MERGAAMNRKFQLLVAACSLTVISALATYAFDRETTEALKACHDKVWTVDAYADLPNAAISVWPASSEDGLTKVYWVVEWTDPDIQAAGQCQYQDGGVITVEPFD